MSSATSSSSPRDVHQQQQQQQHHPELSPQRYPPSFSLHGDETAVSVSSIASPYGAASLASPPPPSYQYRGEEGPSQFTSAMDLVDRLQHQLKAVRLDKGRLEERCFILEKEVHDIARHMQPGIGAATALAPGGPLLPSTTTGHDSSPSRHHDRHRHAHHHHKEGDRGRDTKVRLATAEAQLKSRNKEVQALQERLQNTHASLREAESKYLSDLSRLFKESAHPDLDAGEREKWERELGQALRELNEAKEEIRELRARKEKRGGSGGGSKKSSNSSPLRAAKMEEDLSNLRIKVVRQAETIHADKKVIKLLKKAVKEAQTHAQELEGRLVTSVEAQKKLRQQLLSLAERYEGLMGQLREQVESMNSVAVDEEEEEAVEEEEKRKEKKAKKKHHHHKKQSTHKKETEEENEEDVRLKVPATTTTRRRTTSRKEGGKEQQQLRRRGGIIARTPPPPPQAWEINFVPGNENRYEVSPLIHRFEQSER